MLLWQQNWHYTSELDFGNIYTHFIDKKAPEKKEIQGLIDLRNDLCNSEDTLDSYGFYL